MPGSVANGTHGIFQRFGQVGVIHRKLSPFFRLAQAIFESNLVP